MIASFFSSSFSLKRLISSREIPMLVFQVFRHIICRFHLDLIFFRQGLFRLPNMCSFTWEKVPTRSCLTIQNRTSGIEDADVAGPPKKLDPDDYVCSLSTELRRYFLVRVITDLHIDSFFCQLQIDNIPRALRLGFITMRAHIKMVRLFIELVCCTTAHSKTYRAHDRVYYLWGLKKKVEYNRVEYSTQIEKT